MAPELVEIPGLGRVTAGQRVQLGRRWLSSNSAWIELRLGGATVAATVERILRVSNGVYVFVEPRLSMSASAPNPQAFLLCRVIDYNTITVAGQQEFAQLSPLLLTEIASGPFDPSRVKYIFGEMPLYGSAGYYAQKLVADGKLTNRLGRSTKPGKLVVNMAGDDNIQWFRLADGESSRLVTLVWSVQVEGCEYIALCSHDRSGPLMVVRSDGRSLFAIPEPEMLAIAHLFYDLAQNPSRWTQQPARKWV